MVDLNVKALRLARGVADRTNTLMAGNICNTTIFRVDDEETVVKARSMFKVKISINVFSQKFFNEYIWNVVWSHNDIKNQVVTSEMLSCHLVMVIKCLYLDLLVNTYHYYFVMDHAVLTVVTRLDIYVFTVCSTF